MRRDIGYGSDFIFPTELLDNEIWRWIKKNGHRFLNALQGAKTAEGMPRGRRMNDAIRRDLHDLLASHEVNAENSSSIWR